MSVGLWQVCVRVYNVSFNSVERDCVSRCGFVVFILLRVDTGVFVLYVVHNVFVCYI